MTTPKKLSIIMPVYNVEKYIGECLQSIYNQDIPEEEFEVICVNDCSPDGSRDIVLDFQQKHKNLILLEHETNQTLGAPYNTGLQIARGKYVWFIDSDDFIKENVFGKLLEIAETNKLEILEFNTQEYREGQFTDRYCHYPTDTDVITGIDYLNFEIISIQTWSKFFLKDLLIKNNILFPLKTLGPDQIQSTAALLAAKRYKFISERIYFYRKRNDSNMGKWRPMGWELADDIFFCCSCIDMLDKHNLTIRIDGYVNNINRYRYDILNLPFKEKIIYCNKLFNINRKIVKKYLKKHWHITYPLLIFVYPFAKPIFRIVAAIKKL
jgi:glycosyltransferase involved in cell wall biosynthesis